MQSPLLANCDALELLERVPSASAALVYMDPPWLTNEDDKDVSSRSALLSLYLYCAAHAGDILSESGVIAWHVWPGIATDVRQVLDGVFGAPSFLTEIILKRGPAYASPKRPRPTHTSLIAYSKSPTFTYNAPTKEYADDDLRYSHTDSDGRCYMLADVTAPFDRPSQRYTWRGHSPPSGRSWRYTQAVLEQLYAEGRVVVPNKRPPRLKIYSDERAPLEIGSIWDDIDLSLHERVKGTYPGAQQSLKLMDRVVRTFTNPGDLLIDPFCGTGTTLVAA